MYADLRIQEWVFNADLTTNAKLVLFALIYHADKNTGVTFPSEDTIAEKTSQHRTTVSKALKLLVKNEMIEYLGSSGRSKVFRVNCINGSSPPKSQDRARNKKKRMSRSAASDVAESDIRYSAERHQVLQRATSDIAQSDTNQSIEQKQSTKSPTKERNRPPAIQPTVFKQSGEGVGEGIAADDERERMFDEFWATYPDRCPRKVNKAKCRQLYAELAATAPDASEFHAKALAALKRWDISAMWNMEDGKYICAPYRWLESRLWEDSPAPDKALAAKKAEANRTYDWSLCAERCANCAGDRCGVGIKVPPNLGAWAYPPEECSKFRAAS